MINASRGLRDKIEKYVDVNNDIQIDMQISGGSVYDYCCFGVDANDKLSDDRYMVFYNQKRFPNGEIELINNNSGGASFKINLSRLPQTINKLVFTVSIDGNGTMGSINTHTLNIMQNSQCAFQLCVNGSDFSNEKAIISIEIYRKEVWRVSAVARGFNGGLSALLNAYGGQEILNSPAQNNVQNNSQATIQNPAPPVQKSEKIILKKGNKVSLTKGSSNEIIIENGWTAIGKDYDLKALVRYRNGRTIYVGAANDDESLTTPEGAVRHGGDIKNPGELEHIYVKWHPDIASVAVSSYSAIENGIGSFNRYGVYVRIRNGNQIITIEAADTSANDYSYTLCFGEILFGNSPNSMEVSALEMYSKPKSEHRIGYINGQVVMDAGPMGRKKD